MKRKASKRVRAALLQIYLSDDELEHLRKCSSSHGLPVSTWARASLLASAAQLEQPKRRKAV